MARRLIDCSTRYVVFLFAHVQTDSRRCRDVLQCPRLALLSIQMSNYTSRIVAAHVSHSMHSYIFAHLRTLAKNESDMRLET